MSNDPAEARARYLQRLTEEIERLRVVQLNSLPGGDPRQRLLQILGEMGKRLRAVPGYVEPTKDKSRCAVRHIRQWFREHGYSLTSG